MENQLIELRFLWVFIGISELLGLWVFFFSINSGFEIVGSFFELKESGKMVFFLSFSQPLSMLFMELVLNYEQCFGFLW